MKLNWKLLETASENANHCQRNWDRNTRISKDVRDSLINIATNLPTKQNQAYYHLLVSDNPAYNKKIYECADEWTARQPTTSGLVSYFKAYYSKYINTTP